MNIKRLVFLYLCLIVIFSISACKQKIELKRNLTSDSGWWLYYCQEEKGSIEFCDNGGVVFSDQHISRCGKYKINRSETELKLFLNEGDITISNIIMKNKKILTGCLKLKDKNEVLPIKLEKQQ